MGCLEVGLSGGYIVLKLLKKKKNDKLIALNNNIFVVNNISAVQ